MVRWYGDMHSESDSGVGTRGRSDSWSTFASDSDSENEFESRSTGSSRALHPMLIPILGKELSHVQFRSLEEQLFRSMAVLFDLQERQCVGRLVMVW